MKHADIISYGLSSLEPDGQLWLLGYLLGLAGANAEMMPFKLGMSAGDSCRKSTDDLTNIPSNPFIGIFREDKGAYEEEEKGHSCPECHPEEWEEENN